MLLQERQRLLTEIGAPPVTMPKRSPLPPKIFAAVAGPTPWNFLTGRLATKSGPAFGGITACPFGLLRSLAIFARNLQYEIPAEALSPVTSLIRARIIIAISVAIGMFSLFSVTSRIGFIKREGFDQVGVLGENLPDLRGHGTVDLETGRHKDEIGTLSFCRHRGQGRSHPECAGLIACGGDDAARRRSADGHWLAPEFRIVALLDRGIEGVHVDMYDLADRRLVLAPIKCTLVRKSVLVARQHLNCRYDPAACLDQKVVLRFRRWLHHDQHVSGGAGAAGV